MERKNVLERLFRKGHALMSVVINWDSKSWKIRSAPESVAFNDFKLFHIESVISKRGHANLPPPAHLRLYFR